MSRADFRIGLSLLLVSALFAAACSDTSLSGPELADGAGLVAPGFDVAGAGPPLTGAGVWEGTGSDLISIRAAGNNTIIENSVELSWQGALEGTSVHFGRIVIHGTTGKVTIQNTGEFSGTVAGCDDVEAFTYRTAAQGQLGAPPTAEGTSWITASRSGTGTVLSGVITWSQVGLGGPYEIQYVCK